LTCLVFCCLRSEHIFNNNIKLLQIIYVYIIAIESIIFYARVNGLIILNTTVSTMKSDNKTGNFVPCTLILIV